MRLSHLFFWGVSGGLALAAPAAQGGAFLFPEGHGQVIVTTTFADARKAYDAAGRLIETPPYRKFETKAYFEHGLLDWLNLVGEGSYMDFSGAAGPTDYLILLTAQAKARLPLSLAAPPGPRYEGLGLGAIGARAKLLEYGSFVVSLEASLRGASPAARRFLDMRDPVQVDARLLFGRSMDVFGLPAFVDAQIGRRSRGQNGDEIRADMTFGVRPFESVLLMAQSFSAFTPRAWVGTSVAAQKFQLSAVYDVTKSVAVQIGGVAALGGVNSPAERGIVGGLWWRY
jgi:hypothetical protein